MLGLLKQETSQIKEEKDTFRAQVNAQNEVIE